MGVAFRPLEVSSARLKEAEVIAVQWTSFIEIISSPVQESYYISSSSLLVYMSTFSQQLLPLYFYTT